LASRGYDVPEPLVWVTFIGLMGFGGAFWFAVNMSVATAMMPIAVAVHELGHALVGRAVGLRIFVMNLGQGLPLARFEVGRTRVVIGRFPLHGFVKMAPPGGDNQRLRMAMAILAGPLSHLIWIAPCALLLPSHFLSTDGWMAINQGFAPLHGFVLFNLFALLRNILPIGANDGGLLLGLLLAPRDLDVSEHFDIAEAMDHLERGEHAAALTLIDVAIARLPEESALVVNRALALLGLDRLDEALEVWETQFAKEDHPSRILLANNIAWTLAMRGRSEDMERADELSALVLRARPEWGNALGTRGAYRIASGDHETGERVVKRALATQGDPQNRADLLAWLVISRNAQGDLKGAAKFAAQMAVAPHPQLARRLKT